MKGATQALHCLRERDNSKAVSIDRGDPVNPAMMGWLFLDLGAPETAAAWIDRSLKLGAESHWTNLVLSLLHLYRNDDGAVEYAKRALAPPRALASPLKRFPLLLLRDDALRRGRVEEARALYETAVPHLLSDDTEFTGWDYATAIDLALLLSKTGEQEQCDTLLSRSHEYIRNRSRMGLRGFWIADVQIYALQGEKKKAIATLRQAIEEGWRSLWWYYLKRDPNLAALRGEGEFQAMVAEIEADMVSQLARVREMERRGELPPVPPIGSKPAS